MLGRQRPFAARDAEVGAPDATAAHERGKDLLRDRVDRHCQSQADAGHGGVDADQARPAVDQRAPGVAGVEGGVGLDHAVDHARDLPLARGQAAAEAADHSRRDRAGQAHRVADRHHQLADAQLFGVAQLQRLKSAGPGPDHGQVGERIRAHHIDGQLAAVDEGGPALGGARHHVRGGDQEAVGRERHRRAAAAPALATPAPDLDAGHRGQHPLGHGDDQGGVAVERFLLLGVGEDLDRHG